MKLILLILMIPAVLLNCGSSRSGMGIGAGEPPVQTMPNMHQGETAKNLILMIGDGMGLTQITAGIYENDNFLNFERFPVTGLMKTHSYDNLVTDSAAGGTAMSCGIKTYNNAIGVDKDGIPVKTILEQAEEKQMMTGVVVTSTVVNATPATFMAHQKLRAFTEPIAEDIAKSGVDFLVGGGKKYFDRRNSDERNLIDEMKNKGYQIEDFIEHRKIEDVRVNSGEKFVYFTADDDPLTKVTGRNYLPYASKMGAEFLKARSKNGFFMMIEGSQVDLGGHANNFKYVMTELKDFDEAIKEILQFAEADGETLVIVTADHETGGLTIREGSKLKKVKPDFSYGRHSGTMVPVFAYGPGSENFTGIFDNTALYRKMKNALALDTRK